MKIKQDKHSLLHNEEREEDTDKTVQLEEEQSEQSEHQKEHLSHENFSGISKNSNIKKNKNNNKNDNNKSTTTLLSTSSSTVSLSSLSESKCPNCGRHMISITTSSPDPSTTCTATSTPITSSTTNSKQKQIINSENANYDEENDAPANSSYCSAGFVSTPTFANNFLQKFMLTNTASSSSSSSSSTTEVLKCVFCDPEAAEASISCHSLDSGSKIVVNGKSGKDSTTYLLDHTSPRPPLLSDPWETVSFHELPEWLQDNELLHHHHRPQLSTYARCFASIFRLHTETGNIWTHLIGFLGFLAICAATYSSSLLEYPWEDKAVFAAFFVGITVCLLMSTTFHTVCCHSKMASKIFSRVDYAGIAILIMGSMYPFLYYAFLCNKTARLAYMGVMTFLGSVSIIISLLPRFDEPKYRVHRMATFLCFGVSGAIPMVHCVISDGMEYQIQSAGIGWMMAMGATYIVGAILYGARIPERFFPGKCDLVFQSHQIFHILVLIAAAFHYFGLLKAAQFHHLRNSCQ